MEVKFKKLKAVILSRLVGIKMTKIIQKKINRYADEYIKGVTKVNTQKVEPIEKIAIDTKIKDEEKTKGTIIDIYL